MKKLLFLLLLLFPALAANAQNSASGNITASSTNCTSVPGSCVWESPLSFNASTSTINVSGTFSATLLVEESNNAGQTWATAATITTAGTTTYSVNGFTDIRVRCSAFVSGTAAVTINTGLQTGLQGPAGPAGSGGGVTSVSSLPATCTSGTSTPVQLSVGISVGQPPITYGASTIFYCDSTNHYSPVSQGSGAAPIMGIYLGSQCPPSNQALCFNTPANTQQANDCSWTSGSPTVNCATSHFLAADTGKRIFGYQTCEAFTNIATGGNPITASAAVTMTYVSATQITLSANAANSNTGGNDSCVVWGTPDDSGALAMDTAAQAALQCPKLMFAAGYYLFTTPHFYTQPTACANLGSNFPASTGAGNMLYAAGYELEGRGTGTTVFFMTPGFPETGNCLHGLSGKGCWVVVTEGRWHDLVLTGGGNFSTPAANTNIVEIDGPASLDNFTCINFGANGSNSVGVGAYLWTQLTQVNLSGCGSVSLATNISSSVTAIRLSIDNPNTIGVATTVLTDYYTQNPFQFDKYNLICYDCRIFGGIMNQNSAILLDSIGSKIKLYHSTISPYASLQAGIIGYQCATTANCLLDAEDTFIDMTEGGTNTTHADNAIKCLVACANVLKNTLVKGSNGLASYIDGSASSSLTDEGGNVFGATNTISGSVFGSASITGTTLVTGNVVLTSGWGSGAAASAFLGNSLSSAWTSTIGTGPGAGAVTTVTFPTAFLAAPLCSASVIGGSSTTVLPIEVSATSTAATLTYVGTFVTGTVITRLNCSN